jgi:hypothetical protein
MSGLIYGYIESIGLRREDEAVESHNADVLASLPAYGSYICKEMFAQLPRRRPITYYTQLIHFATEPKDRAVRTAAAAALVVEGRADRDIFGPKVSVVCCARRQFHLHRNSGS